MSFPLFSLLLFTSLLQLHSSPVTETHFTTLRRRQTTATQQYLELTHPLPSDHLTPSCSILALRHNFSNTINKPPITVPYSPPSNCTSWSHIVLEFSASCKGDQYDRIAAVWLAGAELLRTSTAEPTEDGIFWNIRKDVTRYSSILSQSNISLTVMLENIVNDVYTGVYQVNVTFLYYQDNYVGVSDNLKINRKLGVLSEYKPQRIVQHKHKHGGGIYEKPADLIVPVSGNEEQGFWFRIESENDVHYKGVDIPKNAYKAVIEIYVSFHGNDEFWYSNPPDSYIERNGLVTGRGHGAYREVFVMIDGNLVGSVIPFPVIFTGGINPLFWEPVVAIGAFDVPSYDFDLSPFLGLLLDGKSHSFGLGVSESISYWLVDANLHLWLDQELDEVRAKVLDYHFPALTMERKSEFELLDGSFKVEAERKSHFIGWVNSTLGNFTTHISEEFKYKNVIKFEKNGTDKVVKQKVKTKSEVKVKSDKGILIGETVVKRKYPLEVEISNLPGSDNDTYLMITNIVHGLKEKISNGDFSTTLHNKQNSSGWMEVKDHSVLSGEAETEQSYSYRDEFGCYSRIAKAANGTLIADKTSSACASSL